MSAQKTTGKTASIPGGLAWGGAVSLGLTILLSGVLAWLLEKETILWENTGYWIMGMLLLSSFIGAWISAGRIKRQRLVVCLMSGLVYLGVLLSMTALFFGGQYEGVGVTMLLVLGGSMTAALLGNPEKRGGKRRKINTRSR